MLKQVMLGAGGILLAAAIFASSVTTPGTTGSPPAPAPAAVPATAPVAAATRPAPPPVVFSEESGDSVFGAPMIEAAPVDTASDMPLDPAPEGDADAQGGKQFNARPGRKYPVPR